MFNLNIFLVLLFICTFRNFYCHAAEQAKFDKNLQELLLCRKCGADVADSYYIFTKSSSGARKTDKKNLFGKHNVTVQTLVNPFGVQFEVVTIEKSRCENIGPPQGADSWFPGYTWRICACPHCGQHLGWTFERSKGIEDEVDNIHSFHGLILSNILGENYSLIMMPKTYRM